MHLSPKDIEKIMLHNAGVIAQKRYARGILLNYPETIALISTQLLEFIREGASVAELMDRGKKILGIDDVMEGVESLVHEVQVEGTFPDGTKLVTVHQPICDTQLNNNWALYGSGLTKADAKLQVDNIVNAQPGNIMVSDMPIILNEDRKLITIEVCNVGDRPIQVGSHYNFIDTNAALKFDRLQTLGFRLNIPAGTAIRFEPGEKKMVELVEVAGTKEIYGGNNVVDGAIDSVSHDTISERVKNII
ncbi:urease subunit gamma [Saccharicrinis aurantiacus]|uniref:urease subunit gamma n=1 Tax=Saccharicrinis aurantiacus TaxID=1849719 RepID=UPI00248F6B79|nr:urease subunit gamma [Saccharicrinis aurantiacus]